MDTGHIFNPSIPFEVRAYHAFQWQYTRNPVYHRFCKALGFTAEDAEKRRDHIPPLMVEAFRDAECTCWPGGEHDLTFRSSGTTGMRRSVHPVRDAALYARSVEEGMRQFYDPNRYVILAVVPGYRDNPESSLIWMLRHLIGLDRSGLSRFLAPDEVPCERDYNRITRAGRLPMLFGAAFGLMDLAEAGEDPGPAKLPPGSIIVETGGMKTRRREIPRGEMHAVLTEAFGVPLGNIHSEYGMTELLSQAWMQGDGVFRAPHWMQVTVRDPDDPLRVLPDGQEGRIAITDLANLHSCSFLLTGDAGVRHPDGSFEVFGRLEHATLRGCNFLIDAD